MNEINNVAVIGAGTMGTGIAQMFALTDHPVCIVDVAEKNLKSAGERLDANLSFMVQIGQLDEIGKGRALGLIRYAESVKKGAADADFVTEAVFENIELKKDIFRELDEFTLPGTILASNTSSFDINELCEKVKTPERVIGTHWFHPPQITPCVEVIPSLRTDIEVIARTTRLLESMGKVPTLCKSAPGFVANRIQYALVSEALAIVSEGLATPEEVDTIVKNSFGFRLSAFGPCEVCDQAGLDVYKTIFEYFYKTFQREVFKPPKSLTDLVDRGHYGLKTGKGFYSYEGDAAKSFTKYRDKKLYNRLELFKKEQDDAKSGERL